MRPYTQEALELKTAFEAGLCDRKEIVQWADRILMEYDYDDDLVNVSISSSVSDKEFYSLLNRIAVCGDEIKAMRFTLRRMYHALHANPHRGRQFTRFLESFRISQNYDLPEDLSFIDRVDDEFELAERGLYGTVEEATKSLLLDLSQYK